MSERGQILTTALLLLLAATSSTAQVPVDENGNPLGTWEIAGDQGSIGKPVDAGDAMSSAELEELVGPIALYPDDLLAIVLPASAYPLEIVQAARFLERLESDSSLEPDESWDDAVVALLNYPDVVRMMDDDIDWTWRLGEAVISQQTEVIAAVEAFRDRAYAAGNLISDDKQKVTVSEGIVEIVPVSEEIIYVPYYEPAEVVVAQPRPVYYYYPDPYPVYYYPYPVGYRFRSGYFWGVTTAFSIGWPSHYLHVRHPSYWGHPYYGRYYYGHYYRRPSITIYNNYYVNDRYRKPRHRHRDGDYWRPRSRAGSRQYEPRVVTHHYSPNRTRSRQEVTSSSRRDRIGRTSNGRMDLRLRPRSSTAANASRRGPTQDSSGRRRITSAVGNRQNRTSASDGNIRFRDRTAERATAGGRRSPTAVSSRRPRSAEIRQDAQASRRDSPTVTRAPRANREISRRQTAPRRTRPAAAPTTRQSQPPRPSAPAASSPSRRSQAPATNRSSAPPRSNSRASSRGESSRGGGRRSVSSSQRRRSNHDD